MQLSVLSRSVRPLMLLVFLGCAGGGQVNDESRSMYVTQNPDMPPNFANAVLTGQIMIGMDADMVTASWGEPTRREAVQNDARYDERWVYGNYLANRAVTHLYFSDRTLELYEFVDTATQQKLQISDRGEKLGLRSRPAEETKGGGRGGP
jgi:hypothetical protein